MSDYDSHNHDGPVAPGDHGENHDHGHEHVSDDSPETHFARRAILQAAIGAGAGAAVLSTLYVGAGLIPKKVITPENEPIAKGDVLVYATGANKGQVINPADLKVGDAQTIAFPQKNGVSKTGEANNTVLLVRLDPNTLDAATGKYAVDGLVAYSGVCKHLGCVISNWDNATKVFVCPCHQGRYDPAHGCKVTGGPPPGPVPQLPIKVEGDTILADGFFLSEPGKA